MTLQLLKQKSKLPSSKWQEARNKELDNFKEILKGFGAKLK